MPADSGAHSPLARITERVERAAACAIEEVETRILVTEAKTSLRARVANVNRVTKKATKAGFIAGALVAAVVMRERKKRRKLSS